MNEKKNSARLFRVAHCNPTPSCLKLLPLPLPLPFPLHCLLLVWPVAVLPPFWLPLSSLIWRHHVKLPSLSVSCVSPPLTNIVNAHGQRHHQCQWQLHPHPYLPPSLLSLTLSFSCFSPSSLSFCFGFGFNLKFSWRFSCWQTFHAIIFPALCHGTPSPTPTPRCHCWQPLGNQFP